MSDRNGRHRTAPGRLASVIAVAVVVVAALEGSYWLHSGWIRRQAIEQIATCQTSQHKQCPEKGSVADVRSANANEDAVDISIAQVILGIAGFIGLIYTVLYARGAWLAAERSAEAADKTLAATRDGERRQLRAYVVIRNAGLKFSSNPKRRLLKASSENYGQTPAVEVASWHTVIFDDYPLKVEPDVSPPSSLNLGADIVPPHVTHPIEMSVRRRLTKQELRAWLQERKAFYAIGRITYLDIFGDRHTTDYRFYCTGKNVRTGSMRADKSGNRMT